MGSKTLALTTLKICFFKTYVYINKENSSDKRFRLANKAVLLHLAYVIKQHVPTANSDLKIAIFLGLKLSGSELFRAEYVYMYCMASARVLLIARLSANLRCIRYKVSRTILS